MSEEKSRPESSKEAPVAESTAQSPEVSHRFSELLAAALMEFWDSERYDHIAHLMTRNRFAEDWARIMGQDRSVENWARARRYREEWERRQTHFISSMKMFDASGIPTEEAREGDVDHALLEADLGIITISGREIKQLNDKTAEILREAALAYERIGKDRHEIEQLKMETRELLALLRAA